MSQERQDTDFKHHAMREQMAFFFDSLLLFTSALLDSPTWEDPVFFYLEGVPLKKAYRGFGIRVKTIPFLEAGGLLGTISIAAFYQSKG